MRALALGLALLWAGCYSTPTPDCAFLCGAGGSCPDEYFCASDGVCKRDGLANTFDCGFTAPPDAGPPVDAPPGGDDAGQDAGADAGVDAS
jgi:hypothetical protein